MKLKIIISVLSIMFIAGLCACSAETPESKPVGGQVATFAEQSDSESNVQFLSHYLPTSSIDFGLYKNPSVKAKSIYVSSAVAATRNIFEQRLDICKNTEINAMVIDIKESDGFVTFQGIPFADEEGISKDLIPDIKEFLKELDDNNIYKIARIVTFKDNAAVEKHPDFALKLADGSVFRESPSKDKNGNIVLAPAWLNPYNRDVWEYVVSIAKGAAELGFDEIQFDYIRFPSSSRINDAQFGDTGGLSRTEIIAEFGKYAVEQLEPFGVKASADVYGTIILSDLDASIVGQDYVALCKVFDYICPMLYPSHFAPNTMEIEYPDLAPYDTLYKSLIESNKRLEGQENVRAIIRPWLQDFTASYLKSQGIPYQDYGAKQVREQIQACYDAGLDEWLLWSSGGKNTVDALLPKE